MSANPLQDRNGRLVPTSTTEYLAGLERVEPPTSCDSCGEAGAVYVTHLTSPVCLACAMYQLGHDQSEEALIRSMLGAAICAAVHIAGDAGEELVRRAFEDALHERTRVESDYMA